MHAKLSGGATIMGQLVGFKLNRIFPLSPPFYCLECMEALSREKRWLWKTGRGRKGAVPVVEFGGGFVRHLRVPASNSRLQMKTGEWLVEDEGLSDAEEASLEYYMSSLGLRIIPSVPQPAELDISCKNCGVGVLQAPGQQLSITATAR